MYNFKQEKLQLGIRKSQWR